MGTLMAGRLVLAATLAASVMGTSLLAPNQKGTPQRQGLSPVDPLNNALRTAQKSTPPLTAAMEKAQAAVPAVKEAAPPGAEAEEKGPKLKPLDPIPDLPSGPISDANCEKAGGMCA